MKLTGVEHRLTKLEVKHDETIKAIKLQRGETDRRLLDLNHENQRIRDFQSQVPSDDAFHALDERVKILEATAGRLAGAAENRTEAKTQTNFNVSQWVYLAGIAVLVLIDLHSRGVL